MEGVSFSLKDKIALITGASRGIGEAIAHVFAQNGATVILVSRKQEPLDAVAKAIEADGGKAVAIATHCGRAEEIHALMERVKSEFGRLDVLVNNAGTNLALGPCTDFTEIMYDKVMALNTKGPFLLSQHAVGMMIEQGGGSIINISSTAGIKATPTQVVYSMSKFAMIGMTKGMAAEFGQYGVRVNSVAPGLVETKLSQALIDNPEVLKRVTSTSPLRRHGQPMEIAGAALYLASDASAFTTGQVIVCDGGSTA